MFSTEGTSNGYTMLCGDFNAHHPYWDTQKTDKRGNDIFRAYSESNYILLNNYNDTTTPQIPQQASTIDLSFASPKLHTLLRRWEVLTDAMGSNHFPITMQFDFSIFQLIIDLLITLSTKL